MKTRFASQRCYICQKEAFITWEDAQIAAANLRERGDDVKVYIGRRCHQYHVGHGITDTLPNARPYQWRRKF